MFFKKFKNLMEIKLYYKKYTKLTIALLCVMVATSSMGMLLAYLMSEQLVGITNQTTQLMVKFTFLIVVFAFVHHVCWFLWSKYANIKDEVTMPILV